MALRAGVIAVQGDVAEHVEAVERAAERRDEQVEVVPIRESGHVPTCDVLAMPGGESTTISRLLHEEGIATEIVDHVEAGKPLLATCAGLIVAARETTEGSVRTLSLIDVTVERNAFGRQKESFETMLSVGGIDDPVPAVFIRAPVVADVGDDVDVLAEYGDRIVALRDGPVTGLSFHPELTTDTSIHERALFDPASATSRTG
ncbi:MAG: pyridoxal 5'-phosphate synthase glutaminase subunit PdxT [Halodesulfurarchaeum sp.]